MKNFFLLLLSLALVPAAMAQLKVKTKCPDFQVDILDGKVNGIKPNDPNTDIKTVFPCFTSVAEQADNAKCGTSVFFKDRDIYFYTDRDYIQIGPKFKGKLSLPLIGAKRNSMFKWLGNPKLKDDKWDAYQTTYGTLILYFDAASKVNLIQFSTEPIQTIKLCE